MSGGSLSKPAYKGLFKPHLMFRCGLWECIRFVRHDWWTGVGQTPEAAYLALANRIQASACGIQA